MRRVLVCAFAVAATVTPSTHHVERERASRLVFAQAEGATKGPEGDWGLGAQLTALEAVVQRAATPDPAAVSARSSLQESTLREPLDDDPQRTPASLASDHLALVVEGATAMETILGNEELEQRFLKLANVCKAVVACRVSPAQKTVDRRPRAEEGYDETRHFSYRRRRERRRHDPGGPHRRRD